MVEAVQEMDFVGEALVVEWAFSVGWVPDWKEIRHWLSNCTGAEDIGKWGWDFGHMGAAVTAWASPSFFLAPPVPLILLLALVEAA